MPRLSSDQLHDWYQKFSKLAYEKANIDVTRVEDVGRIRNFFVVDDSSENPVDWLSYFMFPYMPHNGNEHVNPAPIRDGEQAYLNWLTANLRTEVNDDLIQELYDMSQAGSLMFYTPNSAEAYMLQVLTDDDGNITVSHPASAYEPRDLSNVENVEFEPIGEDEERPPQIVTHPVKEPDPKKYGLDDAPVKPVKPEDLELDFWSWLGWVFGMDTDYAKLKRYEKESATFEKRWNKWFEGLDRTDAKVSEYLRDHWAREEYLTQCRQFYDHPLGKLVFYYHSTNGYMAAREKEAIREEDPLDSLVNRQRFETDFLAKRHLLTPQGRLQNAINENHILLDNENFTNKVVRNLFGLKTNAFELPKWIHRKVFDAPKVVFTQREAPRLPHEAYSADVRNQYLWKMEELARLASLSALCDPSITGTEPKAGCTAEEAAVLKFKSVAADLITVGNANSDHQLKYIVSAREKGASDMEKFHNGDKQPLCESMARMFRLLNREVASYPLTNMEQTLNTLTLIGRMLKAFDRYPDVLENSGVKPEELEEARANMAFYDVMRKGCEAKHLILRHCLFQKKPTSAELQQAGLDVLFAESVLVDARTEYSKQSEEIAKSDEHKAIIEQFKNPNLSQEEKEAAGNRMQLLNMKRPCLTTFQQLMNPDWVAERKAALQSASKIDKLAEIDRMELGKIISSSSKGIFEGLHTSKPQSVVINANVPVIELQQAGMQMNP